MNHGISFGSQVSANEARVASDHRQLDESRGVLSWGREPDVETSKVQRLHLPHGFEETGPGRGAPGATAHASSSRILPTPVVRPIVAPDGALSLIVNDSIGSTVVSARTGTLTTVDV